MCRIKLPLKEKERVFYLLLHLVRFKKITTVLFEERTNITETSLWNTTRSYQRCIPLPRCIYLQ